MKQLKGRNNLERVRENKDSHALRKQLIGDPADRDRRYKNLLAWDKCIDTVNIASPHILKTDSESYTLAYEWIDGKSVQDMCAESGKHPSKKILADLAANLARINSLPNVSASDKAEPSSVNNEFLLALKKEEYANLSGGEITLIGILQHDYQLIHAVDHFFQRFHRSKHHIGMCHGDFRLDQVMLGNNGQLYMVDFEEFHYGYTICDIAGLIGSLFFNALFKVFSSAPDALSETIDYAGYYQSEEMKALDEVAPLLSLCVTTYEKKLGEEIDPDEIAYFVAWFMIERIISRAKFVLKISPADKAILGIARAIILEPADFTDLICSSRKED